MTRLGFLSPWGAAAGVAIVSPLLPVGGSGVVDVSYLGKLELRGRIEAADQQPGEELVRLAPARALLVTEGSPLNAAERLQRAGLLVYDSTAALAALEFNGEDAMRRLSDLDLGRLPAVGAVAHGVRAVVQSRGGGCFRLYVPRELGQYVAEVVVDTLRGLGR